MAAKQAVAGARTSVAATCWPPVHEQGHPLLVPLVQMARLVRLVQHV
jgi:hypothetical protein